MLNGKFHIRLATASEFSAPIERYPTIAKWYACINSQPSPRLDEVVGLVVYCGGGLWRDQDGFPVPESKVKSCSYLQEQLPC